MDRMDKQVLAAASLLATSIISAGSDGAKMLNALEDKHPKIIPLTQSGLLLLEKTKPLTITDKVEREDVSEDTRNAAFKANMRRLAELGKQLMLEASGRIAAPAADDGELPRVIEVGPDGSPIFDKPLASPSVDSDSKLYNLQLTHDDLHVFFWALKVAEATYRRDAQELFSSVKAYRQVRDNDVPDGEKLQALEDRFNATHDVARRDAGEID